MQVWTSCGQYEQRAGECSYHPPLRLIGCGPTASSGDRCLQRGRERNSVGYPMSGINSEQQHNPVDESIRKLRG